MLEKVLAMNAEEKAKLIENIGKDAQYSEVEYAGCARCTLSALQKYLGLCDDEKFKAVFQAADPFAGGIGGATEICGGLVGGVMAIGLAYSPDKMETLLAETESRGKHTEASDRAYEFLVRFRDEFGGVLCRDVQKKLWGRYWDLRNLDEFTYYSSRPTHDRCGEVTSKAARLAAEVIFEPVERIPTRQ